MVLAIVSPIFDELALPRAYEFTLKMDCSLQLDVRFIAIVGIDILVTCALKSTNPIYFPSPSWD